MAFLQSIRSRRWSRSFIGLSLRKLGKLFLLLIFSISVLLLFIDNPTSTEMDLSVLKRLEGPLAYNDPELLTLVRQNFLQPPSPLPYNLMQNGNQNDYSLTKYNQYKQEFAFIFCQRVIKALFKNIRKGFFVEAGAIDGEFLSNTLYLELENQWTGLLVEVDRVMFKELINKQRKAWSSNTCLATHAYPHQDILLKYARDDNRDIFFNRATSAHGSLLSIRHGITLDNSLQGHQVYERAQCLPLATLLLAIGVTHVDLVSLDVEGAEVGILKNFPWEDITVDVWVVEHSTPKTNDESKVVLETLSTEKSYLHRKEQKIHRKRKQSMKKLFENVNSSSLNQSQISLDQEFINLFLKRGYSMYAVGEEHVIPNYVFVRKNSRVYNTKYNLDI